MNAQRAILLAWLAGLGLLTVRELQHVPRPPAPGRYLAASGLYAALAVLGDAAPAAAPAAAAIAWGFDLALLLQVAPGLTGGTGKGKGNTTAAAAGSTAAAAPGTETA